jgi:hypothetical protein
MVILYTKHAKLRIKQRELSTKQIEETIKGPDNILPSFKNRQLLRKDFSGKTLEIAIVKEESDIIILTAYWLKEF